MQQENKKKNYVLVTVLFLVLGLGAFAGGYFLGAGGSRRQPQNDGGKTAAVSSGEERPAAKAVKKERRDTEDSDREKRLATQPAVNDGQLASLHSELTKMALQRTTREQENLWKKYIPKLLPAYKSSDNYAAAAGALRDYEHVVFHVTGAHNLANNHQVLREASPMLKKFCARWDVPEAPVEAIISWENSGSPSIVSYAGAVGICQMMEGTVHFVHEYAHQEAEKLRREAEDLRAEGGNSQRVSDMLARADLLDCGVRHKTQAKQAKCDERLLANCNLEDSVIYIKYLLEKYDNRADLAIPAYHSGIDNIDDIIVTYVNEAKGDYLERGRVRTELRAALERYDITYADLWRFEKTRAMLGGVRTMDGEITTWRNRREALGDEADLYLWKVLSSWIAYQAGPEYTQRMIENNRARREECAYRGLSLGDTYAKLEKMRGDGVLVSIKEVLPDKGVGLVNNKGLDCWQKAEETKKNGAEAAGTKKAGNQPDASEKTAVKLPPVKAELAEASWLVRPELLGYLLDLQQRWQLALGNDRARLPVSLLSGALHEQKNDLEASGVIVPWKGCAAGMLHGHERGVAVDLDFRGLSQEQLEVLKRLLEYDFVFDRVFLQNRQSSAHVVLNPRWGEEYLKKYQAAIGKQSDK